VRRALILAGLLFPALCGAQQDESAPPPVHVQRSLDHVAGTALREGTAAPLPDLVAASGQTLIESDGTLSWRALGKITTVRHENTDKRFGPHVAYFAEPVVSLEVKALVGKKVKIKGYALPRGNTGGKTRILVSALPAADPDGCAAGGAETFVDVYVEGAPPPVDKLLVVEGTLGLFDMARWAGFIYQLTDVRILGEAPRS
jgi:hypothetical protein